MPVTRSRSAIRVFGILLFGLLTSCKSEPVASYSAEERAAFIPACTQAFEGRGMPALEGMCACVYDSLEQSTPYTEAAQWMQNAVDAPQADTPLNDLLRTCYAQTGGTRYPPMIRRHLESSCEQSHRSTVKNQNVETYCACYISALEKRVPVYDAAQSPTDAQVRPSVLEHIERAAATCLAR